MPTAGACSFTETERDDCDAKRLVVAESGSRNGHGMVIRYASGSHAAVSRFMSLSVCSIRTVVREDQS